jgi:hypothetical protein
MDSAREWRRLTEQYRAMSDDELLHLAADFSDLTEAAKQVLRDEMRNRHLSDPEAGADRSIPGSQNALRSEPIRANECDDTSVLAQQAASRLVPGSSDSDQGDQASADFTWKTVLCECETTEQAQQLAQSLYTAGLDSWVQEAREYGLRYTRVLVAADQLDQARQIAARPIPQEIIDDSMTEPSEFDLPHCPQCGSDEVVLEGVDPANQWRCERCERVWSDASGAEVRDLPSPG